MLDDAGRDLMDDMDLCACGHAVSDHTDFDGCEVPGCDCQWFREKDEDFDDTEADE